MAGVDTRQSRGLGNLLLSAVTRGDSPEEWEGVLRMLGEGGGGVDDAGEGGTPLHTAVTQGRLPWVIALLAQGADPLAERGGRGSTALQVATDMKDNYPNDEGRSIILEFVRMVTSREEVKGHTASDVTSGGKTNGRRSSEQQDTALALRRLAEVIDNVSVELSKVKVSMGEMDEKMASRFYVLSQEISSTNKAVDELKASNGDSFALLNTVTTSSKESFETARKKLTSAVDDVKMFISKELVSNRDTLDRMKLEMTSSKASLETLKTEIISAVEDVRTFIRQEFAYNTETLDRMKTEVALSKESVEVVKKEITSASLSEWRREQGESSSRLLQKVEAIFMDRVREESIEALLRMTLIHGDAKVSRVRSLYERLYSRGGCLTSILVKFLRFHPEVKVRVDCDSMYIERMSGKFRNHEGLECNGGDWHTFPDLEEETVYLGALVDGPENTEEKIIAGLAESLCIMCAHLLFENGGRPYCEGDEASEKRYVEILEGAEERRKAGGGVEVGRAFEWALDRRTLTKSIYAIAGVPFTIAFFGSTSKLKEWQMEPLLAFFEDHVVASLTRDWESKMASSIN